MEFQEFWEQQNRMCTHVRNCNECEIHELDDCNNCINNIARNTQDVGGGWSKELWLEWLQSEAKESDAE